jgi:hypothetical protein
MPQNLGQRPRALACALSAAAGVVLVAGCAAHHTPARGGNEKFVLRSDSWLGDPVYAARASGVFSDSGTFPGIGNGRNQSLARLSGGTFVLTHPATAEKITLRQTDSRTCAVVIDQKGSYTVGRGTGAYKGITGYGTFTADYRGVLPRRNGKCDTSRGAVPVKGSTHAVIIGTGALLLPPS